MAVSMTSYPKLPREKTNSKDPEGKAQQTLQATGAERREAQPALIRESYPPRQKPSP
ncbi:hypothetical protein F2Q68_00004803 [Brassica cretica]|uniref:Uncharacterized protein n=1 Tax=Brassica cretica TaxID=69181 RepID=A0A8S9J9M3_BRACR|nr:hypothetical protein F2Q68_00004803 [Brassica cretica]